MVHHVNVLMTARVPVVHVWLEVNAHVVTTASVVMRVPVVKVLVAAHELQNNNYGDTDQSVYIMYEYFAWLMILLHSIVCMHKVGDC